MGKLNPWLTHNALNNASCTLNFLNVDTCEQSVMDRFWNDGTRVAFAKANGKDPCTKLWKGPSPVLIWHWGPICVFFTGEEWSLVFSLRSGPMCAAEECLPWSDGDVVTTEAFPEGLKRDCWTCAPNPLMLSCCSVRMEGNLGDG